MQFCTLRVRDPHESWQYDHISIVDPYVHCYRTRGEYQLQIQEVAKRFLGVFKAKRVLDIISFKSR